ncbi:hypothetical protein EVAR_57378_1 [Eumeta japonica]|uniref:Uncharacterized protein n=1 Tax=Eumeta variegata TaxID=151549 RepID=A0A4C1ZI07_EUMVA|nr:hypothetical protein EVAR_57378_1 [Eumeta japonica]
MPKKPRQLGTERNGLMTGLASKGRAPSPAHTHTHTHAAIWRPCRGRTRAAGHSRRRAFGVIPATELDQGWTLRRRERAPRAVTGTRKGRASAPARASQEATKNIQTRSLLKGGPAGRTGVGNPHRGGPSPYPPQSVARTASDRDAACSSRALYVHLAKDRRLVLVFVRMCMRSSKTSQPAQRASSNTCGLWTPAPLRINRVSPRAGRSLQTRRDRLVCLSVRDESRRSVLGGRRLRYGVSFESRLRSTRRRRSADDYRLYRFRKNMRALRVDELIVTSSEAEV